MAESENDVVVAFREAGFKVTQAELHAEQLSSGTTDWVGFLSGGVLNDENAMIRVGENLCRIIAWVTYPTGIPEKDQLSLFLELLELNFSSNFGRVSAVRAPERPDRDPIGVFIETVFFWRYRSSSPELFSDELIRRMQSFAQLRSSVLQVVTKRLVIPK